ncbi:MAG: HAMP domain-containing histidine kinase [Chloroflexota bacterium]|nr:HAMP domain-containing histidine kinase [Chloroflexota bacterium]
MRNHPRTLPMRRWLVLALAVTFFVPAFSTVIVAWTQFGAAWHSGGQAAQLLRADTARWSNPAWQAATRDTLARQGVAFILVAQGHELYRSSTDPLAGADANHQRTVQRLVIGGTRHQIAYIYSDAYGWGGQGGAFWLVPLVALAALLATLGLIAWFLGRTLLTPLAATSSAARRIAAGDLDITLPGSRVREVAELNSSFEAMNAELRAAIERQAGLEEERRWFISAIAHDLRTPLFSLRGYLEGLEQGLATTPRKVEQYIQICREKADVLERLIADLFTYTKIEYLEQTLRREQLDLSTLLGRAVQGRQRDAEARGVTLELDGAWQARTLEGDEHLLGRAVENLLDNALRHTPSGGRITVRLCAEGNRAIFVVADTGPGIAPRDLPHVFEPMYRADPSRNRETGGVGLGLAIARRILRAHGGDLKGANRAAGGAEFTGSVLIDEPAPLQTETATV